MHVQSCFEMHAYYYQTSSVSNMETLAFKHLRLQPDTAQK